MGLFSNVLKRVKSGLPQAIENRRGPGFGIGSLIAKPDFEPRGGGFLKRAARNVNQQLRPQPQPNPMLPVMPPSILGLNIPDLSALQNISPAVQDAVQQSLTTGEPLLSPERIQEIIAQNPVLPVTPPPLFESLRGITKRPEEQMFIERLDNEPIRDILPDPADGLTPLPPVNIGGPALDISKIPPMAPPMAPPLPNLGGTPIANDGTLGDFVPPPGYKEGKIGNNPPRDPAAGLTPIRQDLLPPKRGDFMSIDRVGDDRTAFENQLRPQRPTAIAIGESAPTNTDIDKQRALLQAQNIDMTGGLGSNNFLTNRIGDGGTPTPPDTGMLNRNTRIGNYDLDRRFGNVPVNPQPAPFVPPQQPAFTPLSERTDIYGEGKKYDPANLPEGFSYSKGEGIYDMGMPSMGNVYAYGPDGQRTEVASGIQSPGLKFTLPGSGLTPPPPQVPTNDIATLPPERIAEMGDPIPVTDPAPVVEPSPTQTTAAPQVPGGTPYAAGVTQIQSGLDPLTEQLLFGLGGQGGFIPGAMRAAEKVFYDDQGQPVVIDEQVAGFSPDQLAAMQMQRQSLGMQDPY
jgi:hypothetical protein